MEFRSCCVRVNFGMRWMLRDTLEESETLYLKELGKMFFVSCAEFSQYGETRKVLSTFALSLPSLLLNEPLR